jgi:hypothetical protein
MATMAMWEHAVGVVALACWLICVPSCHASPIDDFNGAYGTHVLRSIITPGSDVARNEDTLLCRYHCGLTCFKAAKCSPSSLPSSCMLTRVAYCFLATSWVLFVWSFSYILLWLLRRGCGNVVRDKRPMKCNVCVCVCAGLRFMCRRHADPVCVRGCVSCADAMQTLCLHRSTPTVASTSMPCCLTRATRLQRAPIRSSSVDPLGSGHQ